MRIVLSCTGCGARMERAPSLVRDRSFCSRACWTASVRPPVACRGCSATFARNPKNPQKQYCTWACFKRSRRVSLICQVCTKTFESYVSEQAKRERRGHVVCCSASCRNSYTSRLLGGDGTWSSDRRNPKRSRGHYWRWIRREYLKSVGGRCEGCECRPAVEVHHLFPTAAGGDLHAFDNLMAVCKPCHKSMHAQIRAGAFWDSFEEARRALV